MTDNKGKRRRAWVFPMIFFLFLLLVGVLLLDSNTRIVTSEYELEYPNLPKAFDGYRIVVLSDIHAAEFGKDNGKLISKVRDANPDIIVIAGDLTDNHEIIDTETQLKIAQTLVEGLSPVAPLYYITGNHEWDEGGVRELLAMLGERDVKVLRNRHTLLHAGGDSIILAGTDDPNGPADMIKPEEFVRKIRETEGTGFIVMLEHRNYNLELYSRLGVDLVLSGHSHGGIIRLPFVGGLIGQQRDWFPENTDGVCTMGDTKMVVSRGIGNHTGFPRFLNNPEIVIVVLRNSGGTDD